LKNIITRETLKDMIESGRKQTIIETLPSQYYASAHLPGAVNIPHDKVALAASLLIPDKSERIIVYCASIDCQNSRIAAETLNKLGYSNVYEYSAGKKDWEEAGFPLEIGGEST